MSKYDPAVYELLARLPGRHAQLESARFLKEVDSFFEVTDDGTPEGKVRVLRPEWLGPKPTIEKLSQVPNELSDAYEIAVAGELIEVYWDQKGDADLQLTIKGRGVLAGRKTEGKTETPSEIPPAYRLHGKPDEVILTTTYLIGSNEWPLFLYSKQFTEARKAGKLTDRLKVGRCFAYLYVEIAALHRELSDEDDG